MSNLPTNYVDDVLNADVNTRRKYQMIQNGDGTVSLVDVTDYDTVGSSIGAAQINAQNTQINQNTEDISSLTQHLTEISEKVGGGMRCVATVTGQGGSSSPNGTTIQLSTYNYYPESVEDYIVLIDDGKGTGAEFPVHLKAKTTTSFTLEDYIAGVSSQSWSVQIVALK